MKVNGTKTENVSVEVSDTEILTHAIQIVEKRFVNFSRGYIDQDGFWRVEDGMDYHNNCIDYKKSDMATESELVANDVVKYLKSLKNKLQYNH